MKKPQKDFILYILGGALFLAYLASLPALGNIVPYIHSDYASTIALSGILVIYFSLLFLMRKISRYLAWGFFLSVPALILFVALFIIELSVHPPDEE